MNRNLDTLRDEMLQSLAGKGFAIYHGEERPFDTSIRWNTRTEPDFHGFVQCALAAGIKLMVLHHHSFARVEVDEALEDLEMSQLTEDEYRSISRRLKELREYDGFTCMLELSFDHDNRTYLFHLHTDWFAEFLNLRNDIDEAFPENEDDSDDSMGGYYSKN